MGRDYRYEPDGDRDGAAVAEAERRAVRRRSAAELRELGRRLALAEPYYTASIELDRNLPEWAGPCSQSRARVRDGMRTLNDELVAILT